MKFRVVYEVPGIGAIPKDPGSPIEEARSLIRMVLEDDIWNAAARGIDLGPTPQLRARIPRNALIKSGIRMDRCERIGDEELKARLQEVISGLATLGIYLARTDPLSDRQLYEALEREVLREPMIFIPGFPDFGCVIELISSAPHVVSRDAGLPKYKRSVTQTIPIAS